MLMGILLLEKSGSVNNVECVQLLFIGTLIFFFFNALMSHFFLPQSLSPELDERNKNTLSVGIKKGMDGRDELSFCLEREWMKRKR